MQARMNNPAMVLPDAMQALLALGKSAKNSGVPQAAQRYMPARFSLFRGLVPAISVPWHRITWYWVGVSSPRH